MNQATHLVPRLALAVCLGALFACDAFHDTDNIEEESRWGKPSCGDGICHPSESCLECPEDCGICEEEDNGDSGDDGDGGGDGDHGDDGDGDGDGDGDDGPLPPPQDGPVGFGAGATGGNNPCVVTTLASSGTGSLRDCAQKGGQSVTFSVSGTIDVSSSSIKVASNTTINGYGQDVTIRGMLNVKGVNNIIVRHLTFTGASDDAIRVIESHTLWFDHLDMSNGGDGLIDITLGSTDVTVSWSKFHNHDKVMLATPKVEYGYTNRTRVTLYNNWFHRCGRRYPSAENADIHGFNNYFDGWTNYGVLITESAEYLSESNVYESSGKSGGLKTTWSGEEPGSAVSVNDVFLGDVKPEIQGTVFKPPYAYAVAPVETVVSAVKAGAGPNK